jgi:hypothetical protein
MSRRSIDGGQRDRTAAEEGCGHSLFLCMPAQESVLSLAWPDGVQEELKRFAED